MGISTLLVTRTPVISVRDAERALRTALSRGGDFAELFSPTLVISELSIGGT